MLVLLLPQHGFLCGRSVQPLGPKALEDGTASPGRFGDVSVVAGVGEQFIKLWVKAKRHGVRLFPFHNGGSFDTYLVRAVF
jgi:hypothetical protein